jgi:hypothetical protein
MANTQKSISQNESKHPNGRGVVSDLCVSATDEEFAAGSRSRTLIVEAAFLVEHGVFRRLNRNAESRPSPPDQKQSEHNG